MGMEVPKYSQGGGGAVDAADLPGCGAQVRGVPSADQNGRHPACARSGRAMRALPCSSRASDGSV